jgi:ribosomal protein L4
VDALLRSALELQLRDRRASLESGAKRVGWRLGMGERERIGSGPAIG